MPSRNFVNSKSDTGSVHEEAKKSDNRDVWSEESKTTGSEVVTDASKNGTEKSIRQLTRSLNRLVITRLMAKGRAKHS